MTDRVAARIRALLDKTVGNGCTEAEALAAAAKAAELLSRHGLDAESVRRATDSFEERVRRVADAVDQRLWKVADAIGALCHVRSWSLRHGACDALAFFGPATDVEVAGYLLALAERAMRAALAEFEAGHALKRREWVRARSARFLDAMASRLAERIAEISWTRRRTPAEQAAAAERVALVDAEAARRGIETVSRDARDRSAAEPASLSGLLAAEGVALDAAVATDARPALAAAGDR